MHASPGIAGSRSPSRLLPALLLALTLLLATATVFGLGSLSTPARAAESDTRGLFGGQDPTYDGVYRQSAGILGLSAIGANVPLPAVNWLLRQQCADGSFAAFRPDPALPCPAPDPVTFSGPDTNSTAMAVMALRAFTPKSAASKAAASKAAANRAAQRAAAWLARQQLADGGWEWIRGLGPDATSTSMALSAIGRKGSPGYRSGAGWLRGVMSTESNCGVSFQPGGPMDPLSTSWALIGAEGPLPYDRHRGPRTLTPCAPTQPSVLATGNWLATTLIDGSGQIPSAYSPDETDWNSTALATLALTQPHGSTRAMRLGLSALQANVLAYAGSDAGDMAAALGTLLMVAHAANADPEDFGGVNLRQRLLLSMQA